MTKQSTPKSRRATIETFRAGTFKPMAGDPVTFSAADVAAIAAAYDPARAPAPVVVGHPSIDAPAYGWAVAFGVTGEGDDARLTATVDLVPAFAEAVEAGHYKKISLSLFPPGHAANPNPGAWYPKHVGFLGAAAPAVPGLAPVQLADAAGVVTLEFGDPAFRDVASMFRRFREWLIEQSGLETADKVMPGYSIDWIDTAGVTADPDPRLFGAPSIPPPKETPMPAPSPAAPDPREADIAAREAALAKRERDLAVADAKSFAASLVADGRLPADAADRIAGVLVALAPAGTEPPTVSFSADGKEIKQSAADALRDVLKTLPQLVRPGLVDLGAGPDGAASFAAPDGLSVDPASAALHTRALAYQRQHQGVDYMTAVAAVQEG
jgi:hypothetical protein